MENIHGASVACLAAPDAAPLTDERPGDHAGAFKRQEQADTPNCTDSANRRQEAKAEATMVATAALAGIELVHLADGSWIASKWSLVKRLADTHAATAWLQRVTGRVD